MALARRLARRACAIHYRSLPAGVKEKARFCVLDWAGCARAGARRMDLSFLADRGREARVAGTGRWSSALSAALVNGTAAHLLELDDVHEPSILHPGAPVIAAALAAAQSERASGRRLLEAVVAGYEASIALGAAAQPAHYRFWHTTGTLGTLGAAAAAGKILSLDEAAMESAIHGAATHAAGLWAAIGEGKPSKSLHAGRAAQGGLLAALWVGRGLAYSPTLEGPRGFLAATSRSEVAGGAAGDPAATTGPVKRVDLRRFHILDVAFKQHASCRFTHAAIDAALALREEVPEPRSIRVRVARSALGLVGKPARTPEEARFSLSHCVAAAFARGRVSPEEFTARALRDPRIRRLTRRVRLVPDEGFERLYPRRWPAVVEAEGAGGSGRRRVDHARGSPQNPLARGELLEKFTGLGRSRSLAREVLHVDSLRDVRGLRV